MQPFQMHTLVCIMQTFQIMQFNKSWYVICKQKSHVKLLYNIITKINVLMRSYNYVIDVENNSNAEILFFNDVMAMHK